ncbi:3-keto-5-aminohexanoate cleavage protein [Burkholderia sp. MS455]|uniref:3-keto-5-aminohexanoate cleavage protein n=1 Tax=Burkholderia sp. MS455 TaxID=2811788 RepID=UPI00195C600D|nr:3-keto-5-aminohexanoate cleavage protein [Burkholderia sp. MS455]QRR07586.1 3-keto-5-aminohexanoate cleavage protein [Burkholderia sp. MS455]
MTSMYITAAPTGAVPKWLAPLEPTFISTDLLHRLLNNSMRNQIIEKLQANGWESTSSGGLLVQFGHGCTVSDDWLKQCPDPSAARMAIGAAGWLQEGASWYPPVCSSSDMGVVPREWLENIPSIDLVRRIVLQLTTYGWIVTKSGDLIWTHEKLHTFLPSNLVDSIRSECPAMLKKMSDAGWHICDAGYWQPGKARSPYLPITPEEIADESLRSLNEGAAIIHLHTRELSDQTHVSIPWLGTITVGAQRNQIVLDQYDAIVPMIRENDATAILNLSTSVRGDRQGARSELRRLHLKPYCDGAPPEMASLSPAAVLFHTGGGYDNAPDFLAAQFEHFQRVGTRPEVEVFNHTIVDNATTLYQELLEATGCPVLFMLVAGVDQYRRDPITGELEDDSLIAPDIRKEIGRYLAAGDAGSQHRAVDLAAAQLDPVVNRLRNCFSSSKISLLLPGPLQIMLADLALCLRLDGVRIGLEDGLNVFDTCVPGGVRKARGTWEQVRKLRQDLTAKGIDVKTAEQVRNMFEMPRNLSASPKRKYA